MMRTLDRFSLVAMGIAVAMMLQPWWGDGFRGGFFLTIAATALQIIASHSAQGRR